MTAFLPPNLLALFTARPPIPYLAPVDQGKKPLPPYSGVSAFVSQFEDPTTVDFSKVAPPVETKEKRAERLKKEQEARTRALIAKELEKWDPHENPDATGDAYKTLFVARLSYETSERKLKREFEVYGPIKRVRLVKDKEGKSRGYAFIEFEKERHVKTAYKQSDGKKIDGRRVLVDVERGRTVKGWRPRRLGGGLGGSRTGPSPAANTGRPQAADAPDDYRYRREDSSRSRDRDRHNDRDRDRDRDRDNKDRYVDRDRDRERDRDSGQRSDRGGGRHHR